MSRSAPINDRTPPTGRLTVITGRFVVERANHGISTQLIATVRDRLECASRSPTPIV
jgi:hypothetical protein